jgi:hypothetical protein
MDQHTTPRAGDEASIPRSRSESIASISSHLIAHQDQGSVICGFHFSPAAKTFIAPLLLFATITAAQVRAPDEFFFALIFCFQS